MAKKNKRQVKIDCPKCKGKGFYFVEEFNGYDCYDEPRYYKSLRPCTTCTETITRKKRGYK